MTDGKKLSQPLHAWYSKKQAKIYGFAQYLTETNKTVYVTNVSIDKNIDNIRNIYDDIQYIGLVILCEDVFPVFLKK